MTLLLLLYHSNIRVLHVSFMNGAMAAYIGVRVVLLRFALVEATHLACTRSVKPQRPTKDTFPRTIVGCRVLGDEDNHTTPLETIVLLRPCRGHPHTRLPVVGHTSNHRSWHCSVTRECRAVVTLTHPCKVLSVAWHFQSQIP